MLSTDLLLSPFGARAPQIIEAAVVAESAGFDRVVTEDHLSGMMLDRTWSHEPFTILGAIAHATERIGLGPLVANVVNRHPVQLASATSTLQSLSRGRCVLGIGGGAAPASRYAAEHEAIGYDLGDLGRRRRRLVETIAVVKLLWEGGTDFEGEFFRVTGLSAVVADDIRPPIVVGANTVETAMLGAEHADGVNVVGRRGWETTVRRAREAAGDRPIEIGLYQVADLDHPAGGDVEPLLDAGVDRRVLAVPPPYPLSRLEEIARHLDLASG